MDVDHDLSFRRWTDGSDVVFEELNLVRVNPGSTALYMITKWSIVYTKDTYTYICRSTSKSYYA